MRALLLSFIPTSAALLSIYFDRQNYKRLNRSLDRFVATLEASMDRLETTMNAGMERLESTLERAGKSSAPRNEAAA